MNQVVSCTRNYYEFHISWSIEWRKYVKTGGILLFKEEINQVKTYLAGFSLNVLLYTLIVVCIVTLRIYKKIWRSDFSLGLVTLKTKPPSISKKRNTNEKITKQIPMDSHLILKYCVAARPFFSLSNALFRRGKVEQGSFWTPLFFEFCAVTPTFYLIFRYFLTL